MKTTRLILLLALVLLALLSVDRGAAGGAPAGSKTVYLPLVFKDWTPVTQTHFINATADLLAIDLQVDGRPYASVDDPLEPGALLTLPLDPGEHTVTIELGRWVNGVLNRPYAWSRPFTQLRLRAVVISIRKPALADVLSGFGDELYWKKMYGDPSAPDGFCFKRDGSFLIHAAGGCSLPGTIQNVQDVKYTREFELAGEVSSIVYHAIYNEDTHQFFDLYPPGEITWNVGAYDHTGIDGLCPPVPTGCPVSPD